MQKSKSYFEEFLPKSPSYYKVLISEEHTTCDDFDFDDPVRLSSFKVTMDEECDCYDVKPKEKNMPNTELDIRDQKRHFESRMWEVWRDKEAEADRFFGLSDDQPPKTARDAIGRIYAGLFVLPTEEKDNDGVYGIRWRHPLKKPDMDGKAVAYKKLEKAQQDCYDAIMIGQPYYMREAVQKFEKVTLH